PRIGRVQVDVYRIIAYAGRWINPDRCILQTADKVTFGNSLLSGMHFFVRYNAFGLVDKHPAFATPRRWERIGRVALFKNCFKAEQQRGALWKLQNIPDGAVGIVP